MNDDDILKEIEKECKNYISNHTGVKIGESPVEIYYAIRFVLLRIAKIEKSLENSK